MRPRFSIRRARRADLDRIMEIESASFGGDAYDRNLFAEYFDICGELFLLAERGRRTCGYVLTCTRGERAELVSIAVDPRDRGTGAASALMESTLRRLRRRRIRRFLLMVRDTNSGARAFYQKYGFRKVRNVPGYYGDGANASQMALDLADAK